MYVTNVSIPAGDETEVWKKIEGCLIHVTSGALSISLYEMESSLMLCVEWPSEHVFKQCVLWDVLMRQTEGEALSADVKRPPEDALLSTWQEAVMT